MLGNKYVAGVVGILLGLVILYNAQFFMSKNRTASPAETLQQAQKQSGFIKQPEKPMPLPAAQPSVKEDKGAWKRDPFSLQTGMDSKTAEVADTINLMGIIKRDGRSHALINCKVYAVNDRIGKAVIKEIRSHSIVILTERKMLEISFDDYNVIKEKKK